MDIFTSSTQLFIASSSLLFSPDSFSRTTCSIALISIFTQKLQRRYQSLLSNSCRSSINFSRKKTSKRLCETVLRPLFGERRPVFGPFRRGGVAQAAPLSKLKTWLDSANYRNIMSASSSTVPFPARYRRLASAKIQRGRGGLNGATQLRGNPPIRGFPASAFRASAFPLIGRTNEIRTKNPRFED